MEHGPVSDGWIPLWRKCYDPDHWLAPTKRAPASRRDAFMDLCQMATHQRRTVRDEVIERGELIVSVRTLGERWCWSKSRVERFTSELEARTAIETVRGTVNGTVYRIVNYETYAVQQEPERDSERDNLRDTSGTPPGQEQQQNNKTSTSNYLVGNDSDEGVGEGADDARDGGPTEVVRQVFEYWRRKREAALSLDGGGPRMKLSAKRSSRINARLREGYTPEQLMRAVDGCLASPRNVEGGHTDIELICRDQQHVEQYTAWARRGPSSPNGGTGYRDRALGIDWEAEAQRINREVS
jgi:hypothetical protein